MFCNQCGNVLPDDAKFCNKCGHPTRIANIGKTASPPASAMTGADTAAAEIKSDEMKTLDEISAAIETGSPSVTPPIITTPEEDAPIPNGPAPAETPIPNEPPSVEEPIITEPVTASASVEEPVIKEPIMQESIIEESIIEESIIEEQAIKEPEVKKEKKAKKRKAGLIVLGIFAILLVAVITFCVAIAIRVRPSITNKMQEGDLAAYIGDKAHYTLAERNQLQINLDVHMIENAIFEEIQKKTEGSMVDVSFIAYNPENNMMRASAKLLFLDVEMAFPVIVDFEQDGSDLMIDFRAMEALYGKDNLLLPIVNGMIPLDSFSGKVTLVDVLEGIKLIDIGLYDDSVDLTFDIDREMLKNVTDQMDKYIDTEFLTVAGISADDLEKKLSAAIAGNGDFSEWVIYYTDEGVQYLQEELSLLPLLVKGEVLAELSAKKTGMYEAYAAEIEAFALDFLEETKDYEDGDDYGDDYRYYYKVNGRLYNFDRDAYLTAAEVGKSMKTPANVNIDSLDIIYNVKKDKVGIGYPMSANSYHIVYGKNDLEELSKDEYTKQYKETAATKGKVIAPMPGAEERTDLLKAIRTYHGDADDRNHFVRYLRCDDAYAYAVVSHVDDFEHLSPHVLHKEADGSWKVFSDADTWEDYENLFKQEKYQDINLNIFPAYAPGYEEIVYLEASPSEIEGELAEYTDNAGKIEFYSYIGDYIYVKYTTGEKYIVDLYYGDVLEVGSYADLLALAEEYYFPPYVGLQIDDEAPTIAGATSSSKPIGKQSKAIPTIDAYASSELKSQGNIHYYGQNLLDGDISTVWAEGVTGSAKGQWVFIEFDGEYTVTEIKLFNGHGKSEELFKNNGRPKELLFSFSNGTEVREKVDADQFGYVTIKLDKPAKAEYVDVFIEDYVTGAKYDDICMSEIEMWGY